MTLTARGAAVFSGVGQAAVIWPAYLGLALFPKTRPVGIQMWLAYPVLLGSWVAGSLLI